MQREPVQRLPILSRLLADYIQVLRSGLVSTQFASRFGRMNSPEVGESMARADGKDIASSGTYATKPRQGGEVLCHWHCRFRKWKQGIQEVVSLLGPDARSF